MREAELHRLTKAFLDSGEARSLEEAKALMSRYGVRIELGADVASSPTLQIIALTAMNAAARTFEGNVEVVYSQDFQLSVHGFLDTPLSTFLAWLDLRELTRTSEPSWPTILVGRPLAVGKKNCVRPWANGWRFGIGEFPSAGAFPPACVAAGGLAVSEAFSLLRSDNPYAGRRELTLTLDGNDSSLMEEALRSVIGVPAHWSIGLGHLGQAYAWTLGFMAPATDTTIILQDTDVVSESNLSTSLLSTRSDIGTPKARLVARWLENRDYKTRIVERRFDELQILGSQEPAVALFGVDNAAARRAIERVGFRFAVDAGLGAGYRDFRALRIRTFPGPVQAERLWAASPETTDPKLAPAYEKLLSAGADPCGVVMLASRAVGAPFVGCVAAGFAVAQLVRYRLQVPVDSYVDLSLRSPELLEMGRSTCG
jgi:hypothetical protein